MPASAATMSQAGDILRMDAGALQWQIIAIKWGGRGYGRWQIRGQNSCTLVPESTTNSMIRCEPKSHAKWPCGFAIFAVSSSKTSPWQRSRVLEPRSIELGVADISCKARRNAGPNHQQIF